jgi:CRP-like cAMP-binding protein
VVGEHVAAASVTPLCLYAAVHSGADDTRLRGVDLNIPRVLCQIDLLLKSTSQIEVRNHILASLPQADFDLIAEHLVRVELHVPKQLEAPNRQIEHTYFIEHGFASVGTTGPAGPMQIGLVGCEGMTGLAVVTGHDRTPTETYMQMAGEAWRLPVAALRDVIATSSTLHHAFLRYLHAFFIQTAWTAYTNGCCTVQERLARWLLMADNRVEGDHLIITHEFLSLTLGVRRASITETLRALAADGIIATRRGAITILDRTQLQKSANGAYQQE